MVVLFICSIIGATSAVDTVKLDSMDSGKSIGDVGVTNLTNSTNPTTNPVKGLRVDEYIVIGDTVPVTTGTSDITNNTHIKQLIVQNYRDDMTPQGGVDVQYAIWYFTGNKTYDQLTLAQQTLVDSVKDNQTDVPDRDARVALPSEKTLISSVTATDIKLIGTSSTSTDVTTQTDEKTTIETIIGEDCTKTITTVVTYFNLQTTADTVSNFCKTIKTTDIYNTVTKGLSFDFNSFISPPTEADHGVYILIAVNTAQANPAIPGTSGLIWASDHPLGTVNGYYSDGSTWTPVMNPGKQDLILFVATPYTTEEQSQIISEEQSYYSEKGQTVTNTPFTTTKISEICDPITKIVNKTVIPEVVDNETVPMQHTGVVVDNETVPMQHTGVVVDNETVPMQHTGVVFLPLVAGLMILGGGYLTARRFS